ncbi:cation ABC transporter substrate-binding protein [Malaciobacter pacificus]|uniref:Metal ion ABC transporter, periplasmic metal-binding protein n=1 Tax=Malaciobacter pacificus TaxID=1080223 RepID=A0A5C2H8K5_9BACT|nr:zinc ABC transporter substrate-binding protein [Malaciobacter pacificus]QEP33795.1 metal ion ABC transporter, periplasmic metal-binding protein [Malaciobacter pacificus]GGD33403.1 cation ABC transporter substrate-binding protein [Malaciobacter pacificus]
MKKLFVVLIFLFSWTFLSAKEISVSILPQKYFVEKIVGDKFNVNVMVKPGSSPATYEPKTSQMRDLVKSDIYFSIDVPFEKVWLEKFKQSAKNTLFVDTSKGIEKLAMEAHSHGEEQHHEEDKHEEHDHEEHAHDHGGLDPHIWLDPILVKIQAKNIYDAVSKIDSKNSEFYKANYEVFIKELEQLDNNIKDILKDVEHKPFMVFHPSWGYFAKRYHLEQVSIEVEGKEPKPNQLVEIIEDAKKHNIKVVFVAPQFSQNSAKTISKSLNANVVTINPLSLKWDEELIITAKEIEKSYK